MYLKEARTGKGTKGSVLGTSPFLTKTSTGAGTRKTRAAANHEGRGQGTRDRHPTPKTGKEQTATRPGPRHTDGRPSRKTTTRATRKVSLAVLPLFSPLFRRRFHRFLGRRPRHAAALGTISGVRFASQEQMGRPCRVLLRSWLVSDQLRLSDQLRPFRS